MMHIYRKRLLNLHITKEICKFNEGKDDLIEDILLLDNKGHILK